MARELRRGRSIVYQPRCIADPHPALGFWCCRPVGGSNLHGRQRKAHHIRSTLTQTDARSAKLERPALRSVMLRQQQFSRASTHPSASIANIKNIKLPLHHQDVAGHTVHD